MNNLGSYDFTSLKQELKLRGYSKRTSELYLHYNSKFLKFCKKSPLAVTNKDIRDYLENLIDKKRSSATLRLVHNALRFYYGNFLGRNLMKNIPLVKKEKKMINPLTREELGALFTNINNKKHKLIVSLLYGSGLRVSEAVKLKHKDISISEKILHIRRGKGKKERAVILPQFFLEEYDKINSPETYIFQGRKGHLSVRSVQEIIKKAGEKAKIQKKVHPHLLRHSFAMHLLESNVDVSHIQKVLGHGSIRSTEGYIHADKQYLKKVKSPLDRVTKNSRKNQCI